MTDINHKRFVALRKRLALSEAVSRFDTSEEPQADVLAHALVDLETSFRKCLETLFPNVQRETLTEEELADVLTDIGEELRHIQYHINDVRYFDYLRR